MPSQPEQVVVSEDMVRRTRTWCDAGSRVQKQKIVLHNWIVPTNKKTTVPTNRTVPTNQSPTIVYDYLAAPVSLYTSEMDDIVTLLMMN